MSYFSDEFIQQTKAADLEVLMDAIDDGITRSEKLPIMINRHEHSFEIEFRGDESVPTTRWIIHINEVK